MKPCAIYLVLYLSTFPCELLLRENLLDFMSLTDSGASTNFQTTLQCMKEISSFIASFHLSATSSITSSND